MNHKELNTYIIEGHIIYEIETITDNKTMQDIIYNSYVSPYKKKRNLLSKVD